MSIRTPTSTTSPAEPPLRFMQRVRRLKPADVPADVIAGVTLPALAIPLTISYAEVAGLPPVASMCAAALAIAAYALLRSSRQLVLERNAVIAALGESARGSVLAQSAARPSAHSRSRLGRGSSRR